MKNRTQITRSARIATDFFNNLSVKICVLRVICVLSCALVFSTVFVVSKELPNGVVSGKYFWFYMSMGITSVVILLSCWFNQKTMRFSVDDGLIGLFCLSGLVITGLHNETITTKWTLLLLLLVLYFYFRILFTQHKWHLPILISFLLITGLVESIWGLKQLYGFSVSQHSLFKTTGSFFNPGPYAGYLAVIFPMALYYMVRGAGQKAKGAGRRIRICQILHPVPGTLRLAPFVFDLWLQILGCITGIAILLILPATMSRASWLAAIGGSLVAGVAYCSNRLHFRKHYIQHKKTVWIAGSIGLLLLCAGLAGLYLLKKDSADGRALMWKVAFNAIPHHPWGVGLGNFSGTYGEEQALYFASGQASEQDEFVAGSPEYGFNEYLQICIEWGIIPFLLLMAIIIRTLYIGYKQKQIAVTSALVSLLIFAGMSYPFSVLPFAIILVSLLAAIHSAQGAGYKAKGTRCRAQGLTNFYPAPCTLRLVPRILRLTPLAFGPIFCFILTALCLYNRYPVYDAYKKWNAERIYYNAGLYKDVANDYESIYPYLNDQIQFLFEYAQSLSKSEQFARSNAVLDKAVKISCDPMLYNIMGKNHQALKNYEQAEKWYVKSTLITPNRLYPWYLLAKLYHEMGCRDKVLAMAVIVQTKEPKVHSQAIDEMREEIEAICSQYRKEAQ